MCDYIMEGLQDTLHRLGLVAVAVAVTSQSPPQTVAVH